MARGIIATGQFVLAGLAGLALFATAQAADRITVAVNRLSAGAPLYIAADKGFFAEEGLEVALLHLTSSQAIGLAVVAGDADFAMTAVTAGIYTLAGKGGLKMIAGGYEEHPGFHGVAVVANRTAYEHGLTSPAALAGRSIAITAVGSGSHNQLVRLARKYGFAAEDMRFLPLQMLTNEVSALKGGQVDAAALPATLAEATETSGAGKIIAWLGDEIPTQFGGVLASPTTITRRRALAVRFLRAYGRALDYYDRAVQQRSPEGKPVPGADYAETLRIIARHTGEPEDALAAGLPYFDPLGHLKPDDIAEQIAVYKSLRLVDASLSAAAVLDTSFVPPVK